MYFELIEKEEFISWLLRTQRAPIAQKNCAQLWPPIIIIYPKNILKKLSEKA